MIDGVTREDFEEAMEAVWTELQYQDNLPIRTDDEANDVAGFLTLGRVYQRKAEDAWASNAATKEDGVTPQVEEALHGIRKIAGIYVRAMCYNGIRKR
ncbi:MAG: hypothetical protein DRI46_11310 [Chloroflexi bacterium]|nr:MAG: hypothetical protein DRI46_11310 [Chloroflexota bacterium]